MAGSPGGGKLVYIDFICIAVKIFPGVLRKLDEDNKDKEEGERGKLLALFGQKVESVLVIGDLELSVLG